MGGGGGDKQRGRHTGREDTEGRGAGGGGGVRNKVGRKDGKERQTDSHPNRGTERRNTKTRDEQNKETIRSEFEQKTAAGRIVSLVRLVAPVYGYIYTHIHIKLQVHSLHVHLNGKRESIVKPWRRTQNDLGGRESKLDVIKGGEQTTATQSSLSSGL